MATPSERLLAQLIPLMEGEGYTYRKTNHRFLKKFASGTYEFSLIFDGRGGLVTVDAGFFVHFDALEKHFKKAVGFGCPWSAGASLLNAGANPWQVYLFEDQYAAMRPAQLAGIASEVIHSPARIDAGVRFLLDAHAKYAVPLFQSLQTVRELADFLAADFRAGCTGRYRPIPETALYLRLLAAGTLGDDVAEILGFASVIKSGYVGHDVNALAQAAVQYMTANKITS